MNNKHVTLSVVVITKNEEPRIAKCLESLSFCDEIIVIDNGSTDKTVEIAERFHAHVYSEERLDFSSLRTIGKDKSHGTWILYVDADELVGEKLRHEITFLVQNMTLAESQPSGYFISRENYYLGKKWPVRDRMQRLFLAKKLIRWEGKLHETAIVDGFLAELHEPLIHHTHRNLEEMVEKTNTWSAFEAELRFQAHHPPVVWWRFFRVMMTGFYRSYIHEGGWKAGTVGWIESIYQAFSMFVTYAKLWEKQKEK
jgi:glycosyltransferase involved in cell wall biosynthesis